MFPDENEVRRGLSRRAVRTGAEAWPEVRRKIETRPRPSGSPRILLAALLVILLAGVLWRRERPAVPAGNPVPGGFHVSRVESRGRAASAVILQPDSRTLMVIASN